MTGPAPRRSAGPVTQNRVRHPGSDSETSLESVELGPQHGGQLLAELLEPFSNLGDLLLPLLDVDVEGLAQVLLGHVEPVDVQGARRGDVTDGRLDRSGLTLHSVDDPLQDPAVLAEPGPQEATVVVAAEPVDVV